MRQKKVTFADNIFSNSSLEDIEIFIHQLISQFEMVLINHKLEGELIPYSLLSFYPISIHVTNNKFSFNACSSSINIHLGCKRKDNVFQEYKRYQKNKIIGSLVYVHFQDILMALVAHEYAHYVNCNIYESPKPHGKEFQKIYKILRIYTNSFLPSYAIIGYPDIYGKSFDEIPKEFKVNYKHFYNAAYKEKL